MIPICTFSKNKKEQELFTLIMTLGKNAMIAFDDTGDQRAAYITKSAYLLHEIAELTPFHFMKSQYESLMNEFYASFSITDAKGTYRSKT